MEQSPTIGKLAEALAKAQGAYKPALKDANNPFFKSKYADLSNVIEAIREALSVNQLSVVQTVRLEDPMLLETTLLHSSGEWIRGAYPINPIKNDPQGIGSAVTYARRYSLMAIAGVAAEDDDGEAAHGRSAKVDGATGEIKERIPKWTPEQRQEVGKYFNAIIQGEEGGEKKVNDFREKYKYTDPQRVIELAAEFCKKLAIEP